MGRGVIIALALSLAANVFLGGFLAGRIAGGPGFHHAHHGPEFRRHAMEEFADLPPAARESLKRAFIAHRREAGDMRKEALALHKEFVSVIGAETFDRPAAEAVIAKIEAVEQRGAAGMARLVVEAAAGLSPEDRRALAEHFDRRERGWRERRKDLPRKRPPGPAPAGEPTEGDDSLTE